jgi:glutamyl-tRNA reductase
MMLLAVGCSYRSTPVALRERLAFDAGRLPRALEELAVRYGCEAVILSTCNRVELYLGRDGAPVPLDGDLVAEFLAEFHHLGVTEIRPHLYQYRDAEAVRHLFRVAASLDSLVVGEAQIAGQVKRAYELAQEQSAVGAVLHLLFQAARQVAKRVRTETGIARGHVSISSAAVEFVREVFEHFGDKRVLVIGAGKMGELTLRHLRQLGPKQIWVTNRSPEKAAEVARGCGGSVLPWDRLDDALARVDIVLSTTGAPEPIMTLERFQPISARRSRGMLVIIDIAVPRDFDPRIHDPERTCLFNVDDLMRRREQTLQDRRQHVAAAEAIVEQEQRRFLAEWRRRRHGPLIAQLKEEFEAKTRAVVEQLLGRLNGRLGPEDRSYIEGAFRKLQNQLLHGPISALAEEIPDGPESHRGHTLYEALRKLFRLQE